MTLSLQYKGFAYVAFVNGEYADEDSLSSLLDTGANAIEASLEYGIDADSDTVVVDPNYTDSLADLGATIQEAVGLGLNVMVRPLIDFVAPSELSGTPYQVGDWRSYFNPGAAGSAAANKFFASYKTLILQEAAVAAANGASSFCIGTELDQITGPAYKSYWVSIIDAIRAADPSLKLTYSAEWNDAVSPWTQSYSGVADGLAAGTGNLATQVSFASDLDYLGIDCYAPISNLADPTLTQLIDGWTETPIDSGATSGTYAITGNQSLISYFESVASTVGKPLIFTELGYQNANDADSAPFYTQTGVVDTTGQLQANLYQAFFDAWQQAGDSSLTGVYFWNWDPNSAEVGPGTGLNFSPQGLPAQTVVTTEFSSTSGGPQLVAETNSAGVGGYMGSPSPADGTGGTSGTGALAGDSDATSSTLTITAFSANGVSGTVSTDGGAEHILATKYGSINLNSDGSYRYFAGDGTSSLSSAPTGAPVADVIDFTVTDGNGLTASSTLTIYDYRDPIVGNEAGETYAGGTATGSAGTGGTGVLAGDSDPDGVSLTVVGLNGPPDSIPGGPTTSPIVGEYGTLTFGADGSYSYVANDPATLAAAFAADQNASLYDTFYFEVVGGNYTYAFSQLTITIDSNDYTGGGQAVTLSPSLGNEANLFSTNGDWDAVSGSNGSVSLTDAQASVFGGDDAITFVGAIDDQVSLYLTSGDWDTVSGSGGTIYLTNSQASVFGGADTIELSGDPGNAVSLYGTSGSWDAVIGSNATVYLTSAQASVFGGADTIEFSGGTGNAVSLYATSGAWDAIVGDDGVVYMNGAQASVFGGADTIEFSGGTVNSVSLYATSGSWDAIVGDDGVVYMNGAQASIFGGADTIDFAGGTVNSVSLYATSGAWDAIDGDDGVVYMNGAQASVFGGANTIDFAGGTGNAVSLYGTSGAWDAIEGGVGTVYMTSAQASVFGGGDTIDFSGGSGNAASLYATNGVADTVNGSDGTLYLNSAEASLTGDGDTLNMSGTSTATANGGSEIFAFQAAIGTETINGFTASDKIYFSVSDFASWQVLNDGHYISQTTQGAVITYGADSVTLTNVQAGNLTMGEFRFV